jgi:hypothetical protein
VHRIITTYINDIFKILNIHHHCIIAITINISILTIHHMRQKHNTHKQHIKTQGFNMVHPKLGYVHNDWLLIHSFIISITFMCTALIHKYSVKTQTFPSRSMLQCTHTSLLIFNSTHTRQLNQNSTIQTTSQLFTLLFKTLFYPKTHYIFIVFY